MFNKLLQTSKQIRIFFIEHPRFMTFLKFFSTLIIITILINFVDFNLLMNALLKANFWLVLISVSLIIPNIYFQYKKWEIVSNHFTTRPNKSKLIYSLFYGFTGGILSPARIGEYAGRAIAFREYSMMKVSSAIVIDKLSGMFVIFVSGLISLTLLLFKLNKNVYAFYCILILVMVLIFIPHFINKNISLKIFKYDFPLDKDKISYKKLAIFSSLHYSCYLMQFGIFVISMGSINLFESLAAGSLVIFAKTFLPAITIGDLGVREGASVFFLSFYNESSSVAINASLLLFFINVFIPALIGSILLLKKTNAN